MKLSTTFKKINKAHILAIVFWLIVWQIVSMIIDQEILLVTPFATLKRLLELSIEVEFWKSIFYSFAKITTGFMLAFIIGIITAIIASNKKNFKILIEPLILTIQAIPVASFVILCLIWISSKNLSILISFLMVLPVVYRNVLDGINNIPRELEDMAKVFKVSRVKKIRYIYLSEVAPYLRAACSISLGLCWKSGIAAEVIGMPANSIGEKLYTAKIYLNTPDLFAWTIVIILISICFQKSFLKLIDLLLKRLEIS
ncbi:ABC transporter permease [Clostridium sp.]|jgi:ABC transporter, permease protein|uniref:ABC transporter permease n=1 Tax=Clostridium sp. TaxID=1506 RepID=UPI0025E82B72|nr:ABC transporter permease subunit [Clostridium sp.]MDY2631466.1 ABC transporter permease subunit [Clostridium sp.]MDY4253580.1 ABC transporter permease subunit [Clostridium sp.]